jgi:hypothetical protein
MEEDFLNQIANQGDDDFDDIILDDEDNEDSEENEIKEDDEDNVKVETEEE